MLYEVITQALGHLRGGGRRGEESRRQKQRQSGDAECMSQFPRITSYNVCYTKLLRMVVPLGVGISVSPYVAACEKILKDAGLKTNLHAYGTNIEGEWDDLFAAVKRCHEVIHEMGAPRVSSSLKVGTRTDRVQTMDDKIRSVEEKM